MGCTLDFHESSVRVEFCTKGDKQKILIDVLTKYGNMNINQLASILGVASEKLENISRGDDFLIGEPADSLAQIFLIFFSKKFFRKCTLIRNFMD